MPDCSHRRAAGLRDDAVTQTLSVDKIISTDPPYYDNIGYADLSDFFYVWLRRSLRSVFPDLLSTIVVPKTDELVATPYRHRTRDRAETFFMNGAARELCYRLYTVCERQAARGRGARLQWVGEELARLAVREAGIAQAELFDGEPRATPPR